MIQSILSHRTCIEWSSKNRFPYILVGTVALKRKSFFHLFNILQMHGYLSKRGYRVASQTCRINIEQLGRWPSAFLCSGPTWRDLAQLGGTWRDLAVSFIRISNALISIFRKVGVLSFICASLKFFYDLAWMWSDLNISISYSYGIPQTTSCISLSLLNIILLHMYYEFIQNSETQKKHKISSNQHKTVLSSVRLIHSHHLSERIWEAPLNECAYNYVTCFAVCAHAGLAPMLAECWLFFLGVENPPLRVEWKEVLDSYWLKTHSVFLWRGRGRRITPPPSGWSGRESQNPTSVAPCHVRGIPVERFSRPWQTPQCWLSGYYALCWW